MTGVVMKDTKRDLFALDLYEKLLAGMPAVWGDMLALEKVLKDAIGELGAEEAPRWICEQLEDTRAALQPLTCLIDLTDPEGIVLGEEANEQQVGSLHLVLKNARQL